MRVPAKSVFDSWAILAYLQKEEPAAARVKAILKAAERHKNPVFASLINVGEVFYIIGRRRGEKTADETLEELDHLPIKIVAPEPQTVIRAARLKMHHAISYADAFAVVLAQDYGAVLLTGDPELLKLGDVVSLEVLKRP